MTLLDEVVELGDPDGQPWPERVGDAAAALECEDLEGLRDAVSAPMDIGRFLSNLAASPGLTTLRIPPEPRDAVQEFCN
jgi:hypothetical protein